MNSQIETHDQSSTDPPIHRSTDPPIHRSTDPPIHRSTDPQSINQYKTIVAAVHSRICSLEAITQKNSEEENVRYQRILKTRIKKKERLWRQFS